MEKIIKTQKQFDNIKDNFKGEIIIKDTKEPLTINRSFENAYINISGNATIKYVYDTATIQNVYGNATIQNISDNATIKNISSNATIKYVYDTATIQSVYGNATIKNVYDTATIQNVYGNATIQNISDTATIKNVSDNATIKYVYDNATITLFGLAIICFLYNAKKITTKGINTVRQIGIEKIDMKLSKETTFIKIEDSIKTKPTFDFYKKMYPVEVKKTKAIFYKAVHKKDNEYFSDYDNSFKYEIGKSIETECDNNKDISCSQGIHISHKLWALKFGRGWDDLAILEVETNIKNIVVSKDCDGKIRTSKIKVLREVPKEQYYD